MLTYFSLKILQLRLLLGSWGQQTHVWCYYLHIFERLNGLPCAGFLDIYICWHYTVLPGKCDQVWVTMYLLNLIALSKITTLKCTSGHSDIWWFYSIWVTCSHRDQPPHRVIFYTAICPNTNKVQIKWIHEEKKEVILGFWVWLIKITCYDIVIYLVVDEHKVSWLASQSLSPLNKLSPLVLLCKTKSQYVLLALGLLFLLS